MDLMSEKLLCFLIGVDEVTIKDGKAILKFTLTSERYVCMREAVSFMEEYKTCTVNEQNFLIEEIGHLYGYFNRVLEKAREEIPLGYEYVYDSDNQQVIDEMKKALILKGKI